MNCEYTKYSLSDSAKRMDSAIQKINSAVCIQDSIELSEGFSKTMCQTAYVNASVMSIVVLSNTDWDNDLGQTELSLGYKTIFQETIRLLRDCTICKSYFLDGTHIIAVFDTPKKADILSLIDLSARISSMIEIWRFKRNRNHLCDFRCSIGIHYGKLLKFDEEDSVHKGEKSIYLGNAMQKANLISYQPLSDKQTSCIRISSAIFQNLNKDYQNMFHWEVRYDSYQSSLYNVEMKKWLQEKESSK